ncbi:MAG: hypothetical protein CMJ25_24435 [Phycisphaerae bacterium]|nr:hypothetical protein [Phycisphaerae bacterium]|tara:strand:- start:1155 stop:2258 length:1104 start_codon:yes stop_codon:yes gene_type:complete
MATTTTNYTFNKPAVGADTNLWGGYLNDNWAKLDNLLGGSTPLPLTGIDIDSGSIDGTAVGENATSTGAFTTLSASGLLTPAGGAQFNDDVKATFGSGTDLEIFHDGTNSLLNIAGSGNVQVKGDSENLDPVFVVANAGTTANSAAMMSFESDRPTDGLLAPKIGGIGGLFSIQMGDPDNLSAYDEALVVSSSSTTVRNTLYSAKSAEFRTSSDPTVNAPNALFQARSAYAGSNIYLQTFKRSSGDVAGAISLSGGTTVYATTSDYRVKEDVQDIDGATASLLQLNPVNFRWASSEERTNGFLAHEVQAIVPDAVTGVKDATYTYVDEDGVEHTKMELQGLDQAKLVPLLVKTVQELEARISALESA